MATNAAADERLERVSAIIADFDKQCAEGEHTDSGDAWDLLYRIKRIADENKKAEAGRDWQKFEEGEILIIYPGEVIAYVDMETKTVTKVRDPAESLGIPKMEGAPPEVLEAFKIAQDSNWPSWEN